MTDPKMPPNVMVRELVWENLGRCIGWKAEDENTHLHTSLALDRFYQVAKGKDGWWVKWQGKYHAEGLPTPEAAKAAAQADYTARILSALEVVEDDVLERAWMAGRDAAAEAGGNYMSDDADEALLEMWRNDISALTPPTDLRAALTKGLTDGRT